MTEDLVRRARRGDEAAVEAMVREHQEAMFRLAYLLLGDAADAEDTAQEALIRALASLHRFDTSRPMRPWLLSITANLAKNRLRSHSRYQSALRRAANESLTLPAADEAAAEAQTLWQAVRQLQDADQEVIYLRFFLELSVTETAQTLRVREGTIKSRLSRALTRLRQVLARDFPDFTEDKTHEHE
jgi:RNA polymerase sigma-70 factor, ECF subfamily